jgi:hypothetical protein
MKSTGLRFAALCIPCTALATSLLHSPATSTDALWDLLDRDRDGVVSRYEGAEAWLVLNDEADANFDGGVSREEFDVLLTRNAADQLEERVELFDEFDQDGDGTLTQSEVPEEFLGHFERADGNGDGSVTMDELAASGGLDDPRAMFEGELLGFLGEFDADGDDAVSMEELPDEVREEMGEFLTDLDTDDDGIVTKSELFALVDDELKGATFEIDGEVATMTGVIGASTPGRMLELILEHPEVDTIVMQDVPGSMDDEANLRAARYVRRHRFHTHLPSDGEVASGGTDFFQAGATRTAEPGARFGVHSWSGMEEQGADLPRDHPEHQMYLGYYREMGIPLDFYWYTLEAASADDIHWMTPAEIVEYSMLTERQEPGPDSEQRDASPIPDIDTSQSHNGIVPIPESAPQVVRDLFVKYTRIVAPNGRPIHLFAQDKVTDEMLVRAREVMRFYLTDAPGTKYGADKSGVANAMGDRRATLVYFNRERDAERAFRGGLGDLDIFGQDLYATESVVEGSVGYRDNSTRDATLEEVFHLVHGAGIQPALPEYHDRIEEATRAAIQGKRWFTNAEWKREGCEPHEYIISVIDVIYGLWAHDPDGNGESFHGEYRYCTPAAAIEHDALGVEVLREFLPEDFSFDARVTGAFKGTFTMTATSGDRSTLKTQHLTHVQLTGEHDANLIGNARDNRLGGNAGNNVLEGRGGNDDLNGGPGQDVAVLQGKREDYTFERTGGVLSSTDRVRDRDSRDTYQDIEQIRFADGEVAVRVLAP